MWSSSNNSQSYEENMYAHFSQAGQANRSNHNLYEGLAAELQGSDAFRTLFLGDLSYFCTEEDLCAIFAPFGNISTVRVRRGVTGESLMHGFIALDSHDAAKQAIAELDAKIFMGRSMRVQLSSEGPRPSAPKEGLVQIHVSFISKQLNFLVTEVVLREIFSPFGRIADVAVRRHTIVQKQNRQSGYGFVYFSDIDAAYTAMAQLKQNTIRDITFDCSISHKSEHFGKASTPKGNEGGHNSMLSNNSPVMSSSNNNFRGVGVTSSGTYNQHLMQNNSSHSNSFSAGQSGPTKMDGSSHIPSLYIPHGSSMSQMNQSQQAIQQQMSPSLAWGNPTFDGGISTSSTPRAQPPLSSRDGRVGSGDMSRDFSYMSLQNFQSESVSISSNNAANSMASSTMDMSKMMNQTWASAVSPSNGSSANTPLGGSQSTKSRLTANAPEFVPASASNAMFSRLSSFTEDRMDATGGKFSPIPAGASHPPVPPTSLNGSNLDTFLGLGLSSYPAPSNNTLMPNIGSTFPSSLSSSYTSQGNLSVPSGTANPVSLEGGNRSRHGSIHSGYSFFENTSNNSATAMNDLSPLSAHRSISGGSTSALFSSSSNAMFMPPSADAAALSNISSLMGGLQDNATLTSSYTLSSSSMDDPFGFGLNMESSETNNSSSGRSLSTFLHLGLGSSLGENNQSLFAEHCENTSSKMTF